MGERDEPLLRSGQASTSASNKSPRLSSLLFRLGNLSFCGRPASTRLSPQSGRWARSIPSSR